MKEIILGFDVLTIGHPQQINLLQGKKTNELIQKIYLTHKYRSNRSNKKCFKILINKQITLFSGE